MVPKKASKPVSAKKPVKPAVTSKKPAAKTAAPVKQKIATKTRDLPIAAVIRIAKASGAERVGSDAADLIVRKTEAYLGTLTKEANKQAAHAGRKTLREEDIEMASQNL